MIVRFNPSISISSCEGFWNLCCPFLGFKINKFTDVFKMNVALTKPFSLVCFCSSFR